MGFMTKQPLYQLSYTSISVPPKRDLGGVSGTAPALFLCR